MKPDIFLLSLGITGKPIERKHESFFLYMTVTARLLHAQSWKDTQILTPEEWIMKLMELAQMAKLATLMKDKSFLGLFLLGDHSERLG